MTRRHQARADDRAGRWCVCRLSHPRVEVLSSRSFCHRDGVSTDESPRNAASVVGVVLDIDIAAGIGTVFRPDGKYATIQLRAAPSSPIVRSVHMIGLPYVVATTDRGEDITVELPTLDDASPLDGRRVVYLDQQAWSTLSRARYEPASLPADELDAALWLIGLVENRSVVLPYSAGGMSETTHWSDRVRRRNLAMTVATLSRGWQMLDPLMIRARELEHVLTAEPAKWPLPTAWTLAPNGAYLARDPVTVERDLPAELELVTNAASSALAAFSTILGESIPRTDAPGWAARWARLATELVTAKTSPQQAARTVHGAVLVDAGEELQRAQRAVGLSRDDLATWLANDSQRDVATLPAFGLASEVMLLKIRNSGAKWTSNDLVDIFYLVQAAGYADAVVGEKGFVTLIRDAQRRLSRPQTAHRTLAALRADFPMAE